MLVSGWIRFIVSRSRNSTEHLHSFSERETMNRATHSPPATTTYRPLHYKSGWNNDNFLIGWGESSPL
jgi:hypothetical protein